MFSSFVKRGDKSQHGFHNMSERKHKRASSKGGKASNPNKGFGSLTKEQRIEMGRRAGLASARARRINKGKE